MNILLLVCIEGLILERVPGWIEPHGLNGQHVRLAFFWWWGNPYPTLKTIMSQYDAGCIDKVVQVATTQCNNLNGRGSTEKFNNDSNPATSSPIPIPTSETAVPPPRSTFKSIVLVLTVTFSMVVNVGYRSAVPVPPTHTFAQKTNKS